MNLQMINVLYAGQAKLPGDALSDGLERGEKKNKNIIIIAFLYIKKKYIWFWPYIQLGLSLFRKWFDECTRFLVFNSVQWVQHPGGYQSFHELPPPLRRNSPPHCTPRMSKNKTPHNLLISL